MCGLSRRRRPAAAVYAANRGAGASQQALLDGFHPALAVSVAAAVLGLAATLFRPRELVVAMPDAVPEEALEEAA